LPLELVGDQLGGNALGEGERWRLASGGKVAEIGDRANGEPLVEGGLGGGRLSGGVHLDEGGGGAAVGAGEVVEGLGHRPLAFRRAPGHLAGGEAGGGVIDLVQGAVEPEIHAGSGGVQ